MQKVHTFQKSLEVVIAQLCEAEQTQKSLSHGGSTEPELTVYRNQLKVNNRWGVGRVFQKMKLFMHSFQSFSGTLAPLQRIVEDINDQASDFTANNVVLSRQILTRLEDINTRWDLVTSRLHPGWQQQHVVMCRWKLLQLGLDDHYKRLNEGKGKERLPTTQVYLTWPWGNLETGDYNPQLHICDYKYLNTFLPVDCAG